ncbi:MAG: MMPL family transporter, partial [Planctomycetes bacterium]|nr:MMPL family transporter [Planctomycetota bacterium]
DSLRLYPFIGLVIIGILFLAFRTTRGIFIPLFVVIGSVIIALGSMASFGIPMYIISSALPIILIAIGVADGIHIISAYYEELALRPHSKKRPPVVRAMNELWGPILFTSLTDAAGFSALAAVSFMPPMRAFGTFAAIGAVAAGAFSLFTLPAILVLLPVKPSPAFKAHSRER